MNRRDFCHSLAVAPVVGGLSASTSAETFKVYDTYKDKPEKPVRVFYDADYTFIITDQPFNDYANNYTMILSHEVYNAVEAFVKRINLEHLFSFKNLNGNMMYWEYNWGDIIRIELRQLYPHLDKKADLSNALFIFENHLKEVF